MSILQHVNLVKNQVSYHQYRAQQLASEPEKQHKQEKLLADFSALLEDIQNNTLGADSTAAGIAGMSKTPTLQPSDLDGLPQEVIDSLELTEAEQIEFKIVNVIDSLGGSANIVKILIGLYHDTGEQHDKKSTASRLYRMAQKGLIYSSIEGKGIYTTDETKAKSADDETDETVREDDSVFAYESEEIDI